ncbi:hypothetical protein ABL78_7638 [Leptomonas seymouri]|uniref:Uncharacterized protein n=1 Tax=Leptomonas seymouri TaxID=5684 RepID=A0A0N0P2T4_LEPSE|nr:hypothetical protein ABL78_7638 [Leptomonas seymouri]|eukprot:KPI83329.1 hypothetical protein ABL78_7638 [Leptomonas seymouri]
MSSDDQLNAKLTGLLRIMVSRLPPNKKLPTAVVQQLLRTKYGEVYPEAYVKSHETFIEDTILKLSIEKEKAAMSAATAKRASSSLSSAASDEESEDESEEDSDSDEDDGEEEEASTGLEEDEDDEDDEDEEELDSDDEDSDCDSEADDDDGEPDRKKARQEELDAIAKKEQQQLKGAPNGEASSHSGAAATLAERCKAMAECLRKLSYRVRAPSDAETLEEYLQNFLIAEFKKHGMDPEKYSKSDIKRYRIKREVELLQQDGASLSLDRRNRAGRGFSNVEVSPDNHAPATSSPTTVAKKTSMFLDDE